MIHLHLHTMYSTGDALPTPAAYAKAAGAGSVLAITDHNTLGGAVAHQKACNEYGVKPIFGAEVDTDKGGRWTLLARNGQGYRNLCRIVRHVPVSRDCIYRFREGLTLLSGDLKSMVCQSILREKKGVESNAGLEKTLRWCLSTFGDHFYLEKIDHGLFEQQLVNEKLEVLSEKIGIPVVETNDVHFLEADDAPAHAAMICDALDRDISAARIQHLPEAHLTDIEGEVAREIADACRFELSVGVDPILPTFDVPDNHSPLEVMCRKAAEGVCRKRQTDELEPVYRKRLRQEAEVVRDMGYVGYFLIVQDFIKWAKGRGIPVGPGRGSGAGSLLAWGLDITGVDPIEHDLLFERFLNPERVSMPDFDIDFGMERRGEVIAYVRDKYGADCVTGLSTYGKLKARGAFKAAARIMSIDPDWADQISDIYLPESKESATISDVMETDRLDDFIDEHPQMERVFEIAQSIENVFRDVGRHAGGVVIADRPVWRFGPLKPHPDEELDHVLELGMEDAEEVGLVKFDFLGLKELTVIRRTRELDDSVPDDIPDGSQGAYEMISSGNTLGVFQMGSKGFSRLVQRLKPRSIKDNAVANALYRPGPMDSGMVDEYCRRRNGESEVTYLHDSLEPILEDTLGIIVFQEQVMQIAQAVAGYSLGEADLLRRAMGKKKQKEMDAQKSVFTEGAVDNGFAEDDAEKLWGQIETFSRYGFNRSHATCYGQLGYITAYLKCHHTAPYLAAQMDVREEFSEVGDFVREARRMGIQVVGPSVNQSGVRFRAQNDTIIIGLNGIRDVSTEYLESIVDNQPYHSLSEFFEAVQPDKSTTEGLALAGAFDDFLPTKDPDELASVRATIAQEGPDYAKEMAEYQAHGQQTLIGAADAGIVLLDEGEQQKSDRFEMANLEHEKLGFFQYAHPCSWAQEHLDVRSLHQIEWLDDLSLSEIENCGRVRVLITVEEVKTTFTKNNDKMAFLRASDQTGAIDLVVFPDTFELFRLETPRPKIAMIEPQEYEGNPSFVFQGWKEL